jgi:glucose-6-phosphate 1-dehydrogenase
MLNRIVILGATGDLTSRYLLPSLAQILDRADQDGTFHVVGVARRDWSTDAFQRHIAERLERFAGDTSDAVRQRLVDCLFYVQADVTDPDELAEAFGGRDEPVLAYLALPPAVFPGTIDALARLELPQGSRVVIEKPFGEDLESAIALNRQVHEVFPEDAIFRIDHFLGKQTVQNILGLRFANRIFEPLWNCHHIRQVEIIWDETLALEGRAGYYDHAGALKDMIQNHLLQLLCFIAMEPPTKITAHELRDRKADLLRAVRRFSPEEIKQSTYRGRYTSGEIDGEAIPSYVDEDGVDPTRNTETFSEVRLTIDNWRWGGVPFVLRSGKALGKNRRLINVHFQDVPHLPFDPDAPPRPNVLRMQIDPDRMHLDLNVNEPGELLSLRAVDLGLELAPPELPAYGTLLLEILRGDPMLFIRDDEAEESWRIVEPILDAWSRDEVPMHEYEAGSDVRTGLMME